MSEGSWVGITGATVGVDVAGTIRTVGDGDGAEVSVAVGGGRVVGVIVGALSVGESNGAESVGAALGVRDGTGTVGD